MVNGLDFKLIVGRNLLGRSKRSPSSNPLVQTQPLSASPTIAMGGAAFRPRPQIPDPNPKRHRFAPPNRAFNPVVPRRREAQPEARRRPPSPKQLPGPLRCPIRHCRHVRVPTPNPRARRHSWVKGNHAESTFQGTWD